MSGAASKLKLKMPPSIVFQNGLKNIVLLPLLSFHSYEMFPRNYSQMTLTKLAMLPWNKYYP